MTKISVIVPVYNCEDYIEESMKSILSQSYEDIEVICVDDGSSDNSLEILRSLESKDSRLKVYSQENQGASAARNNAMKKMTGDYVYFFDADDYLVNDALEKVLDNAIANDADMTLFKYDQYRDDTFLRHLGLEIEEHFPDADFSNFTFNCHDFRKRPFRGPFAPWFKLYKRDFLDSHESFVFPINLNHNDVPFHVKTFLKASKISFVPEYLYHYRTDNPNSISNTRLRKYKDIFSIIKIIEDFLIEEDLYEEFKKELEYFKINRIVDEIRGRPNEYFLLAKEELSKINLDNDLVAKNVIFKAKTILDSSSIEEYKYKLEIDRLEKENRKLSKKNSQLKKEYEKAKKKNEEIKNSNSWKMTKALRKPKQWFKSD
ncbi:glycosyltransferase family 2 protein [uncultured Methanobrevibacter sp.]|uniref:glycosyltransferase family 2 protein n=1 Tax=uncultured Methanobrevibacter sp. TaxID=253161 RepID=UPI00260FCC4F